MENLTYLQYQKDLNYPIYISLDLENFEPDLLTTLKSMGFEKLSDKDFTGIDRIIQTTPGARLLHIKEATPLVARQIDYALESDKYGRESLVPQEGYKVYRYSKVAMLIFSFSVTHWEMACFSDFGSNEDQMSSYRIVINRFLSWALASHAVVGFWGMPVKEGAVILKKYEAEGEVVFFDIKNQRILSLDGVKKIRPRFKILKLDQFQKTEKPMMNKEELLSFLSLNTSYLDLGNTTAIRQLIQVLCHNVRGVIHPQDGFQPRSGPSLS